MKQIDNYYRGIFWLVVACFMSSLNDVLMRAVGDRLSGYQIIFFRFLFTFITILPFALWRGVRTFKTKFPFLQGLRVLLGTIAIMCAYFAVNKLPLSDVTTFFFTQPLFFLPLAAFFLKEKMSYPRIIATILGFIGIAITQAGQYEFNIYILYPLVGAFLFAFIDVITKKMTHDTDHFGMVFYFSAGTTVLGVVPALFVWQTPTLYEILILTGLGIGGNLIQFFILRAFLYTQASALAPFRYVDLLFSIAFGLFLFGEIPNKLMLIGALVVVLSTLYISLTDTLTEEKKQKG